MSPFGKVIVLATFIGQVLFVPTALWALTQSDLQLTMGRWSRPIGTMLAPLSLLAVALLFHDLYKRQFKRKKAWVAAILLTGGVAMIPYTFIHAFRPRIEDARV